MSAWAYWRPTPGNTWPYAERASATSAMESKRRLRRRRCRMLLARSSGGGAGSLRRRAASCRQSSSARAQSKGSRAPARSSSEAGRAPPPRASSSELYVRSALERHEAHVRLEHVVILLRVEVPQRAEVEMRQALQLGQRNLVRPELPELELQPGDEIGLAQHVGRGGELAVVL